MRWKPVVVQSGTGDGLVVSVGHPLVDAYLEFLRARARLNTIRAVAFDLKVFFSVVGKTPVRVTSADVMSFIASQRGGDGEGHIATAKHFITHARNHDRAGTNIAHTKPNQTTHASQEFGRTLR